MADHALYPRFQYALIDGWVHTRLIAGPDEEQPDVWMESPADLPEPPPPPDPPLAPCCLKLKAKFDEAWTEKLAEIAGLRTQFEADWTAKVNECAGLEAQVEELKVKNAESSVAASPTSEDAPAAKAGKAGKAPPKSK